VKANSGDPHDRGGSGVWLAELVAAFSLATDLGFGLPMERVLRSRPMPTRRRKEQA